VTPHRTPAGHSASACAAAALICCGAGAEQRRRRPTRQLQGAAGGRQVATRDARPARGRAAAPRSAPPRQAVDNGDRCSPGSIASGPPPPSEYHRDYVVDARTTADYAVHEDEPMNPASNVKLISPWRCCRPRPGGARPALRSNPDRRGPRRLCLRQLGPDPSIITWTIGRLLAARGIRRRGDVLVGPQRARHGSQRQYRVADPPANPGEPPQVSVTRLPAWSRW
jgi:hypothetical protein